MGLPPPSLCTTALFYAKKIYNIFDSSLQLSEHISYTTRDDLAMP